MPKSVITFIISMSLFLLFLIYSNLISGEGITKMPVVRWIIWIILIVGVAMGNRIARFFSILFVSISTIGVVAAVAVPVVKAGSIENLMHIGGLIILVGFSALVVSLVMLFRHSMKEHVGLICPSCKSKNTKSKDFTSTEMMCKDCANTWK